MLVRFQPGPPIRKKGGKTAYYKEFERELRVESGKCLYLPDTPHYVASIYLEPFAKLVAPEIKEIGALVMEKESIAILSKVERVTGMFLSPKAHTLLPKLKSCKMAHIEEEATLLTTSKAHIFELIFRPSSKVEFS